MDHQIDRNKKGSKSRKGSLFSLCSYFAIRSILPLLLLAALLLPPAVGTQASEPRQMHPKIAARIALMNRQKEAMELLSDMAAGRHPFDAKLARAARKDLMATTKALPKAFKKNRQGLQSHAMPEVWLYPDDFKARAETAQKAARGISTRNVTRLRKTLPPMVQACISCHQGFRAHDREFTTH